MTENHSISYWFWRSKLLLGLALLFAGGIFFSPQDSAGDIIFLAPGNLLNILRQVSITGILAVGMTLVILTGGIDLAVGSLMAFAATLCAMLLTLEETHNGGWIGGMSLGFVAAYLITIPIMAFLRRVLAEVYCQCLRVSGLIVAAYLGWQYFNNLHNQASLLAIILASITATALLGSISGQLIARGKLQPFIATLAMMVAALGIARLMAGQDMSVFPIYSGINSNENFEWLRKSIFGIPVPGFVFLLIVVSFTLLLRHFRFGRYLYAIGGNERAAYLSGIPVARVKVWVYTLSGALAGIAGVLYCAQYLQGKPDAGTGMELDAIAAVVIGGANLMGGRGTIPGTLLGVLIFGVLSNVLQLNNVDSNTQLLLKGIIIVLAVLLQQFDWNKLKTRFMSS
ncbi:ABC transporter permease [uncultured Pseudoteredinibacter sp.]|uniref:ABC transporter permease n=1 Tax=uncultured Pseudoteredinibacter sp. TaxID=1641701 RepID=UPI00260481F9|nr:ABC transporter permease [uncultured Pseudoteredinibacter sp.]